MPVTYACLVTEGLSWIILMIKDLVTYHLWIKLTEVLSWIMLMIKYLVTYYLDKAYSGPQVVAGPLF